jgi:hypothetical protein
VFYDIFRFVHLTELITPVSCEDAVSLAIAADQYIIDSLREYTISLIREKINPSNICQKCNLKIHLNTDQLEIMLQAEKTTDLVSRLLRNDQDRRTAKEVKVA